MTGHETPALRGFLCFRGGSWTTLYRSGTTRSSRGGESAMADSADYHWELPASSRVGARRGPSARSCHVLEGLGLASPPHGLNPRRRPRGNPTLVLAAARRSRSSRDTISERSRAALAGLARSSSRWRAAQTGGSIAVQTPVDDEFSGRREDRPSRREDVRLSHLVRGARPSLCQPRESLRAGDWTHVLARAATRSPMQGVSVDESG